MQYRTQTYLGALQFLAIIAGLLVLGAMVKSATTSKVEIKERPRRDPAPVTDPIMATPLTLLWSDPRCAARRKAGPNPSRARFGQAMTASVRGLGTL